MHFASPGEQYLCGDSRPRSGVPSTPAFGVMGWLAVRAGAARLLCTPVFTCGAIGCPSLTSSLSSWGSASRAGAASPTKDLCISFRRASNTCVGTAALGCTGGRSPPALSAAFNLRGYRLSIPNEFFVILRKR